MRGGWLLLALGAFFASQLNLQATAQDDENPRKTARSARLAKMKGALKDKAKAKPGDAEDDEEEKPAAGKKAADKEGEEPSDGEEFGGDRKASKPVGRGAKVREKATKEDIEKIGRAHV